MSYFIVFVITLIFGVELSFFLNKGFGRTAALGNFILLFVLYFTGLFKNMRVGMYIWLVAVFVLAVLTGIRVVKNKEGRRLFEVIKNPIFIFYAVLGISLGIMFLTKISSDYDELSHWALVCKNIIYYDNFGNLGDTTTMFNRYVPGTAVFMYAFQFFNPTFVNGNLYAAFDIFLFSMLLPLGEKFKRKLSVEFFATMVLMLWVPKLFKVYVYENLLVDSILAVMMAYIFIAYLIDRKNLTAYTALEIGLGCFVVCLTKSSGVALASIALCFIAADIITRGRKEFVTFIKQWKNIIATVGIVLFIVFAEVSWSVYCNVNHTRAGWDSSEMTFSAIIEWLKNPTEFQSQVTDKFIKTFFVGEIKLEWWNYQQLPAVLLFGVYAAGAIILGLRSKKIAQPVTQFVMTCLALCGYGFFMLLLYLFSFSYGESLQLASYARYMTSYTCASVLIWIAMLADAFMEADKRQPMTKGQWLWCVPATALAVFFTIGTLVGYSYYKSSSTHWTDPYKEWISAVEALDAEDRVYYVMKDFYYGGDNVREYLRIRYYATPTRCCGFQEGGSYTDGRNAPAAYTGNPFSFKMSVEEFAKELEGYDYVFIDNADEAFQEKYGSLFADEIKSKVLYKIDKANGIALYRAQ